ncbi:MAG: dockerin type I repeat-containing protein [bacterium]
MCKGKKIPLVTIGVSFLVFFCFPLRVYSFDGSLPIYKSDTCRECHCNPELPSPLPPQIRKDHGNHPSGRKWADTSCAVSGCHSSGSCTDKFRLDGYEHNDSEVSFWQLKPLPFHERKFDCISCHSSHHENNGEDPLVLNGNPSHLLYADFQNDNPAFCEYCHGGCKASPKGALSHLAANNGKHYKTIDNSPIVRTTITAAGEKVVRRCGGCMFCHFIHLDQDDPRDVPKTSWPEDKAGETFIQADINALMRVPPRPLEWGNQGTPSGSNPIGRYEALCYGCHGYPAIVGGYGENGSLLKPEGMNFSHRFACKPSSENTITNTGVGAGKFPLADGKPGAPGGIMDDYGTAAGQIYCGTCHDVHNNQKPPYLYQLSPYDVASPYKSDDGGSVVTSQAARDGFCEQCHCSVDNPDPMHRGATHPVGKRVLPLPPKTVEKFTDIFFCGGSGLPYGITYSQSGGKGGVICLTCHNVHAASTSWNGTVPGETTSAGRPGTHGRLLVKDNNASPPGGNLCQGCHNRFSVDGSPLYGGHLCTQRDTGEEIQVCAACHRPHGAKGNKIWARDLSPAGTEIKTKDLCVSCHHRPNNEFCKISSGLTFRDKGGTPQWDGIPSKDSSYNNKNGNVFELQRGETDRSADHVMGEKARRGVEGTSMTAEVPHELRHFSEDEGFYCGSCHDPHKQPNGKIDGNGDYLRVMYGVDAGTTHNRRKFCRQCHPSKGARIRIHDEGSDPQCEACHRPHDGYKYENDDDPRERLIFVDYLPLTEPFQFPYTPELFDLSSQTSVFYKSTHCTSCHLSYKDPDGRSLWPCAPKLSKTRGHHPMGRPWQKTSCAVSGCHTVNLPAALGLFRLDGYARTADGQVQDPLPDSDPRKIFSCISCHAAHTDAVPGNEKFLLYDNFKDDATAYCEHCHTSASESTARSRFTPHAKTKEVLRGKHLQSKSTSPNGRGGCMFCHFTHLNDTNDLGGRSRALPEKARVSQVPTQIKALMRVPAKRLDWDTQGMNITLIPDSLDRYEALCYGCHGDPSIVNNYGEGGSLLNPSEKNFHSHRFACKPEKGSNTLFNLGRRIDQFPIGDGQPGAPGGVRDDYGTVAGQIYCGTCHDVHDNGKPPYLYRLSADDMASPYKSDDTGITVSSQAEREGFCEQCHCTPDNPDPMGEGVTHPVGEKVIPNPPTLSPFPETFYGGGSGSERGITYGNFKNGNRQGVICLTCHNVHAATTPWSGTVGSTTAEPNLHGYLLVEDNYQGPPGSNMCLSCHDSEQRCNGDANQDGGVTPADALLIFKCYLDIGICPSQCADVNKDGGVTPADALCIFKRYLGLPSCLD